MLSKASQRTLAIGAKNWSESAHRFLKQCVDAGNVEACYILGMVNHDQLYRKKQNFDDSCFWVSEFLVCLFVGVFFYKKKFRFDFTVCKTEGVELL